MKKCNLATFKFFSLFCLFRITLLNCYKSTNTNSTKFKESFNKTQENIINLDTLDTINHQIFKKTRRLDEECKFSYVYDSEKSECVSCKDKGKFYSDGKCVDKCDLDYRVIEDLNVCYRCEDLTKVYYEGECIEKCPDTTEYIAEKGLCYVCSWKKFYYSEGACVRKCPIYTMKDEENKICILCKQIGKYVHNMKCVDECPSGTILNDYFTNFCIDCYKLDKYNSTGFCYDTCIDNTARNITKCIDCGSNQDKPILNNGKCDSKCNPFDTYDPIKKRCVGCKSETPSKFYLNLDNDSKCVSNCGNHSTNFEMNYCITDEKEYCNYVSDSCNDRGVCKIINSDKNICLCEVGVYGKKCQFENSNGASQCINEIDDMLEIIAKVEEINFSIKDNLEFHSIFDEFYNCANDIPQYLSSDTNFKIIQNFILRYYSSDEVKFLKYEDIKNFINIFDVFFNLQYYNLWNNHTILKINQTELKTQRDLYLQSFDTFLLRLFMLAPNFFSENLFLDNDFNLAKYDRIWGEQIKVDLFNPNTYDTQLYNKFKKENYHSYFRFELLCNFTIENPILFSINLESDVSFFSDTVEYFSDHFYLGVLGEDLNLRSVECPPVIYFKIKDNHNFNFSLSIQKWREIEEIDINPFDPTDPYFSSICYRYPLNSSLNTYTRKVRLNNYFMNYTLKCMAKTINSEETRECRFVGFEDSFEDYGPNPYVKCQCDNIDSNSYYYIEIRKLDEVNLGTPFFQVFFCMMYGFNYLTSFYNPGFFAILFVFVFQGVGLILHFITLEIQFMDYYEWIRRHDMENIGLMTEDELKKNKMTNIKKNILKNVLKFDGSNKKLSKSIGKLEKENLKKRGALLNTKKSTTKADSKNIIHVSSKFHMSDYYYLPHATFLYIDDRDLLMYFCDFWHDYHIFSITFIKFGYFMPRSLRTLNFFLYLMNHFFFVALILSPEEEHIDIFGNNYAEVIFKYLINP